MENKEPILVVKDLKQHFKINRNFTAVSYKHLRAHDTRRHLV